MCVCVCESERAPRTSPGWYSGPGAFFLDYQVLLAYLLPFFSSDIPSPSCFLKYYGVYGFFRSVDHSFLLAEMGGRSRPLFEKYIIIAVLREGELSDSINLCWKPLGGWIRCPAWTRWHRICPRRTRGFTSLAHFRRREFSKDKRIHWFQKLKQKLDRFSLRSR